MTDGSRNLNGRSRTAYRSWGEGGSVRTLKSKTSISFSKRYKAAGKAYAKAPIIGAGVLFALILAVFLLNYIYVKNGGNQLYSFLRSYDTSAFERLRTLGWIDENGNALNGYSQTYIDHELRNDVDLYYFDFFTWLNHIFTDIGKQWDTVYQSFFRIAVFEFVDPEIANDWWLKALMVIYNFFYAIVQGILVPLNFVWWLLKIILFFPLTIFCELFGCWFAAWVSPDGWITTCLGFSFSMPSIVDEVEVPEVVEDLVESSQSALLYLLSFRIW